MPDLKRSGDQANDRKMIDQAIGCPSRAKQHDRATAIGGSDRDRDRAERSDRSGGATKVLTVRLNAIKFTLSAEALAHVD